MVAVQWKVQLPYAFHVAATDLSRDPELAGIFRDTDYRLVLPRPEQISASNEFSGIAVWSCNIVILETNHPRTEIEDIVPADAPRRSCVPVFEILNLFLKAVRYRTRQLQVRSLSPEQFDQYVSVTVFDDPRRIVRLSLLDGCGKPFMAHDGDMVESCLDGEAVMRFIEKGGLADIDTQLLYDAYNALEIFDIPHSVLLATMSAEMLIKRYVIEKGGSPQTFAADAYHLDFTVTEFLDKVLRFLEERHLSDDEKARLHNLDRLFETRNRIIHEDTCGYMVDGGCQEVGSDDCSCFLDTVRWLFKWLAGTTILKHPGAVNLG